MLKALDLKVPEIEIVPVQEITAPRSWAVYGRSGSGKTTFAGSFPKPLLLVDVQDKGTRSIRDVEGIDAVEVSHWDQFEQIYDRLCRRTKYRTVVIDTLTQAQLLSVNRILQNLRRPRVIQVDWGTLSRQQWVAVSSQVKELITLWRNLPLEACFICQERINNFNSEEEDASEQLRPEIGPALSPQTAQHLNASVEIIANCFIRTQRRSKTLKFIHAMKLGPNPVYVTKARKSISIELPSEIDNPTHEIVVDIIEGRLE